MRHQSLAVHHWLLAPRPHNNETHTSPVCCCWYRRRKYSLLPTSVCPASF